MSWTSNGTMFHSISCPVTFQERPQWRRQVSLTVAKASQSMSSRVSPEASLLRNVIVRADSSPSVRELRAG